MKVSLLTPQSELRATVPIEIRVENATNPKVQIMTGGQKIPLKKIDANTFYGQFWINDPGHYQLRVDDGSVVEHVSFTLMPQEYLTLKQEMSVFIPGLIVAASLIGGYIWKIKCRKIKN